MLYDIACAIFCISSIFHARVAVSTADTPFAHVVAEAFLPAAGTIFVQLGVCGGVNLICVLYIRISLISLAMCSLTPHSAIIYVMSCYMSIE